MYEMPTIFLLNARKETKQSGSVMTTAAAVAVVTNKNERNYCVENKCSQTACHLHLRFARARCEIWKTNDITANLPLFQMNDTTFSSWDVYYSIHSPIHLYNTYTSNAESKLRIWFECDKANKRVRRSKWENIHFFCVFVIALYYICAIHLTIDDRKIEWCNLNWQNREFNVNSQFHTSNGLTVRWTETM